MHIPDNIKQLFAGDEPTTDTEVTYLMNWLMLNHGYKRYIPDFDGTKSMIWLDIYHELADLIKLIFSSHINKIKPAFAAIIRKNGPLINIYWWDDIVAAGVEAVDFVASLGVSFISFRLNLSTIIDNLPVVSHILSNNLINCSEIRKTEISCDSYETTYVMVGFYEAVGGLIDANNEQAAEIDKLRLEIAELRLRPPELGGPDYEAAKAHFDREKSTWQM